MREAKICRYCGLVIDIDAKKCKYCKRDIIKEHDNPDLFCQKCKSPVNTDDNFCQKCGAIFNIPDEPQPIVHNIMGIPYNLGILLTSFAASIAITVFCSTGKDTTVGTNLIYFGVAFIVSEIFLYIYFLPSIIAIENNHHNTFLIYICNLLFGITIIGWFITLVFAMQSDDN